MSDLIDRAEAIRIASGYCHPANVAKELGKLPAVEPEIIRCKDCEWFRKEYGWNCIEYTVCGISPTHHPIRREEDFCSKAERREECEQD